MILDKIGQITPDELAAAVYQILYAGTSDFETYEKMKDRRLIPILNTIIQAKGRPSFAPQQDLPKDRTDRVMISAAYLLADIAERDDQETVQTLMDMLDDENDRVKLAAARTLGELEVTEASAKIVAFTERMMGQGDIGAISKLAPVLAKIGGEEAKACLETFITENKDDENKHVQHIVSEAEAAIKEIDARIA
ncbi:MAG: HEAT repeat domain-containing protein [Anaerolineae bacterium]|jgi:HEAT repeat protein